MQGRLHVIGAATSAGAHGPGQEEAPAAFRRHGLLAALAGTGLEVVDHGEVVRYRMRPDPGHDGVADLDRVVAAARAVADEVEAVLRAEPETRVLVLGGDCTIQLGVIAGSRAAMGTSTDVGLAYVDLDCDLTSPVSGNGIADWMGLTHLLDAPDADPRLSGLGGQPPLLPPDRVRLVAADLATAYERERLASLRLVRFPSAEVQRQPGRTLRELASWADGLALLSVHVDVDVLDQTCFPIAEERREVPGLSVDVLDRLVTGLMAHPAARLLTVCEVNPTRPSDPKAAFGALVDLIANALAPAGGGHRSSRPLGT